MAPKFVPRQRKHKVLARQKKARQDGARVEEEESNVQEILPEHVKEKEEKRARMREELRSQGVKVSSKKAKRMEKYIDTKLKKDENREMLAKLAERQVDTSLFTSSRALGHNRETKRESLIRALREKNAGISTQETEDILFKQRAIPEEGLSSDADEPKEQLKKGVTPATNHEKMPDVPVVIGTGLKRPLEVAEDGRPKVAKRQKRGGVKSKVSLPSPPMEEMDEESDEFVGFSSDDEGKQTLDSDLEDESGGDEEASDPSDDAESNPDSSSSDDDGGDADSSDSDDDDSDEGDDDSKKERPSAFKQWAHRQRNDAMGYQPADTGPQLLQIPSAANFKPRPLEQDPLPLELQPSTNTSRIVYSVAVSRPSGIQEARLKLPVVAEEQKIMEAIHDNDVVVICGATGSGKTTQLPQFLFESGYGAKDGPTPGLIGITQPRRVAAVSMSKRVGQELGDHSHVVAYQIRFEKTLNPKTAVKFMTDGVLLREVAQDFALKKYSAIIVDEAHERSVNTDILVGMLSRVVKLRAEMSKEDPTFKPLKVIIMSATLRIEDMTQNPNLFRTPPPVLQVEGRQFTVTDHFSRRTHHDYVEEAFKKISRGHKKLPPGAMLVFLTGQNEILQLSKRLKMASTGTNSAAGPKVRIPASEAPMEAEDVEFGDWDDRGVQDFDEDPISGDEEEEEDEFEIPDEEPGTGPLRMHILPLYSLLSTKEQMRVFEPPPDGSRLIVLATNVAETSLTIPGIRYVFDCGRSKERRYDRINGVQSFKIDWISKASANQRSGRAGRTGPGHCYRLYSSAVYERDFQEFSAPELLRMPIEGVVLQLKSMNIKQVANFPFPTKPERESLVKAEKLLKYLTAITDDGKVTEDGKTMSIFPLPPRFARIILTGHLHGCLPYTIALVAGLSAAEIFIPENQAIPTLAAQDDDYIRTQDDIVAENRQAAIRKAYNAVNKNFCFLDDKSDAIKVLQVVGEFAHEPTEEWCESHFVRYKVLKEIQQLRRQLVDLIRDNIPEFAGLSFVDKLDKPTPKHITMLKQMVTTGFIDQVAIRADKSPTPLETYRKPRRAIDVPYLPLMPLEAAKDADPTERAVFIHPGSPLAHLSPDECPDYVVYSSLQRGQATGAMGERKPKTRMHALTDITGGQLANLAKGTPLITYGKPIKEIKGDTKSREVLVVPYLRAEGTSGMGWPLPGRRIKQKRVPGKGWVVE